MGLLTALKVFNLHDNKFSGTLPDSVGDWTRLTDFIVSGSNSLSGSLPDSITSWTNLLNFNVVGNALTGTIPRSIGNWSSIESALFNRNNFTGSVPAGICSAPYDFLWADCFFEMECSCCTECFEDGV